MHKLAGRVIGGCSLLVWAYLALFRGRFWALRERLPQAAQDREISVTAVIPARNEEQLIGRAVTSLRKQRFQGLFRIAVADDGSADHTAEMAKRAGADRVVAVGPAPFGWKGKLWALAEGVREAESSTEFVLLTDADIEHAPESVANLVAKAQQGFDLVSVMVRLRCESFAEQMLIPAFVFFFFMLYPPAYMASQRRLAAAAGGCMLIRREMLARIGGFDSIRDALIDDCALAKIVKQARGRVWLGVSDMPTRSMRGYRAARDIRRMIARSAFAQLDHSALLLAATVAGILITYIAPVYLLTLGDPVAAASGAVAWLLSAVLFLPTVRFYGAPLWTATALPAIAAFYLLATVESAVDYWSGRGGEWKGRIQDARGDRLVL